MAKEEDIYKRPIKNITELRIEAARIVHESGSGENPIAILNGLIEAECRAEMFRARFGVDGQTLPATALQLAQDAGRNANHRRTLARNLNKASGVPRLPDVEAHHIVSVNDIRALPSRKILYSKGISVNDADNGSYQPASSKKTVSGLEAATPHRQIHTDTYHLNVYKRLQAVSGEASGLVRQALRTIKGELAIGIFIF